MLKWIRKEASAALLALGCHSFEFFFKEIYSHSLLFFLNEMAQSLITHFFGNEAPGALQRIRVPDGIYTVCDFDQRSRWVPILGKRRPSDPCMHPMHAFWIEGTESIEKPATLVTTMVHLEAVGCFWHTALSKKPMKDIYTGMQLRVQFDGEGMIIAFQRVSY